MLPQRRGDRRMIAGARERWGDLPSRASRTRLRVQCPGSGINIEGARTQMDVGALIRRKPRGRQVPCRWPKPETISWPCSRRRSPI